MGKKVSATQTIATNSSTTVTPGMLSSIFGRKPAETTTNNDAESDLIPPSPSEFSFPPEGNNGDDLKPGGHEKSPGGRRWRPSGLTCRLGRKQLLKRRTGGGDFYERRVNSHFIKRRDETIHDYTTHNRSAVPEAKCCTGGEVSLSPPFSFL